MKYYKIVGCGPCGYTDYEYKKEFSCAVPDLNYYLENYSGYCTNQIKNDIARYVRTMSEEKLKSYGYCSREVLFHHIYDHSGVWEIEITEEEYRRRKGIN